MQKNKFSLTGRFLTATILGAALLAPLALTSPAQARPNNRVIQQRRAAAARDAHRSNLLEQRRQDLLAQRQRDLAAKSRRDLAAEHRKDLAEQRRQDLLEKRRRDLLAQRQRALAAQRRKALQNQRRTAPRRTSWNQDGRRTIVRGTVTRDLPGDRFAMQSYAGRNFNVILTDGEREPRSLNRGTRVQVGGYFRGNTFYAYDVNV